MSRKLLHRKNLYSFRPTDIPNLQRWYVAQDLIFSGLANGASVTSWPDRSFNQDNLKKASGTSPTFTLSSQAGLPTVDFSSNQYLSGGANINISGDLSTTVFVVGKPGSTTGLRVPQSWGAVSTDTSFNTGVSGINNAMVVSYVTDAERYGSVLTAAFHLLVFHKLPGPVSVTRARVDGSEQVIVFSLGTGTNKPNVTNSHQMVGAASSTLSQWGGQISEMIVYSSGLSNADIAKVESYLNQRYDIF